MRHLIPPVAAVSGALLFAGCLAMSAPAAAQQAPAPAPSAARYLSWSGKVESPSALTAATAASPQGLPRHSGLIPRLVAVSTPMAAAPVRIAADARYAPAGNRLTPASAWMGRPSVPYAQPDLAAYGGPAYPPENAYGGAVTGEATAPYPATPLYAPPPVPPPAPLASVRPASAPTPISRPGPSANALITTAPADAPMSAYADPPVPSLQAPQPGFEAAFDPMAPRRDAPIFNMGRSEPAPVQAAPQSSAIPAATTIVPTADAQAQAQAQQPAPIAYAASEPARQGARYYSVHRAAGHQPDATVMPTAVYLDTAPINLAEPPETQLPARTVNGRAQNIVPNEDPSLP